VKVGRTCIFHWQHVCWRKVQYKLLMWEGGYVAFYINVTDWSPPDFRQFTLIKPALRTIQRSELNGKHLNERIPI